jgi:galactose mutarotase-like enzyme
MLRLWKRAILTHLLSKSSDMHTLKNNVLTVQVSDFGAELQSINKNGYEYLWQGDPAFWGRRSPVLFPIVGSVWEKKFRVDGNEYEMGQHGFARDSRFDLVSASDSEVWYRLESSEETLAKYPWPFVLEIGYKLDGSELQVLWKVTNPSQDDIFFQIGAHPAFNYPDYDEATAERGFFVFDSSSEQSCPSSLECIRIREKGCVDAEIMHPLALEDGGVLPLDKNTFDIIDTIMLQDGQVSEVALLRPDKKPHLTVRFDAPVIGLWSPPGKNAPFICIEPWYGRCDRAGFEGDYREKDWMNRLASREKFESVYTIEIA